MGTCAGLGVPADVDPLIYKQQGGWMGDEREGKVAKITRPAVLWSPRLVLGPGSRAEICVRVSRSVSPHPPLPWKYPKGCSGGERKLLGNLVSDGSAALALTGVRLTAWDFFPPLLCLYGPVVLHSGSGTFGDLRQERAGGCEPPWSSPRGRTLVVLAQTLPRLLLQTCLRVETAPDLGRWGSQRILPGCGGRRGKQLG